MVRPQHDDGVIALAAIVETIQQRPDVIRILASQIQRQTEISAALLDLASGEDFAKIASWQAIVSWKFPVGSGDMALEPIFRIGWADTNTDISNNEVWSFTPGLQIFFYKRNKLALNWDIASPTGDALRSENSFKARLQFHF